MSFFLTFLGLVLFLIAVFYVAGTVKAMGLGAMTNTILVIRSVIAVGLAMGGWALLNAGGLV